MLSRTVTSSFYVGPLLTGHFVTGSDYYAYRPGGTDDYLMVYTLAGQGRFGTPDGREHIVHPHDLVLIKPGAYQDYGVEASLQHWELLWTHFRVRAEWIDLLDWPEFDPGLMRIRVSGETTQREMIEQFHRVHRAALLTGPLRDRIALNALEGLLLMCEQINPNRAAHTIDSRIREAMDYVARHLETRLTLNRLAEVSGLSVSRFGHRFREVAGIAPMEFVERRRVERAKQLLTMTSLSIKEISRHVGYDTQFYFSLRFKKQLGMSPKAYRERAAVSG